ncbi:hypothetical protein BKD26_26275 [Streptomyces sp. CB03238]|nr:hypothetical protein BKD26_26275 [Streptomyces sp. CB03238]
MFQTTGGLMPNEDRARALPLSDRPTAHAMTAATELSLMDEELLERYPAVRGVAERWTVLERELREPG